MPAKSPPTRTLREHPDLDQLKRQAKELLAAFVAGEPHAVAEVNAHYRDADPTTFALHDAQLVLARSCGFGSWPRLKAYVDGATVARLSEAVRAGDISQVRTMLSVRPELATMDVAENNEHQALHYAVLSRRPEMVRVLMEHGADPRKGIYPQRDATSALTFATERGYDDIVAIIQEVERRRDTAIAGPNLTWTPGLRELLDEISRGDELRAIAMLEASPALIHAHTPVDRWTPLHMAAARLKEQIVGWLLDHGADVNGRSGDWTSLDAAASRQADGADVAERFARIGNMLRTRGAELSDVSAVALGEARWVEARHAEGTLVNPPRRSSWDGGLLTTAVVHDRPAMLALLLDLGFDPDERMRVEGIDEVVYSWGMPLQHCADSGKIEMAEMLLGKGADPNGQVYASGSPMSSAYRRRDATMISLLERYGGVVTAATAGYHRDTKLAKLLLADEAAGRLTAGAVSAGKTVAEELLDGDGGDPDIVGMALERIDWPPDDPRWYSTLRGPLSFWNHVPWIQSEKWTFDRGTYLTSFRLILARCHANVSGSFGRTILHDVIAMGRRVGEPDWVTSDEVLAFATTLIDAGARLNVRDDLLKSTPLGWACRWGRVEVVTMLLERGADPSESDAEPWATPKAWAEKMKNHDVLAVLREHGIG